MGPLKLVGQVYIHIDSRDSLLSFFCLIKDCDRIGDIFDANFADIYSSEIRLVLNVFHLWKMTPDRILKFVEVCRLNQVFI